MSWRNWCLIIKSSAFTPSISCGALARCTVSRSRSRAGRERPSGQADLGRRRLLEGVDLFPRIAGERRLGIFLDDAVERLLRVGLLAGLEIGPAQLHQDAVDRKRAILPLCEILERRH